MPLPDQPGRRSVPRRPKSHPRTRFGRRHPRCPRLAVERLEDRLAPAVTALSLADPGLLSDSANGESGRFASAVSRDGRYVAFVSKATNLLDGQIDTTDDDLFLLDRATGKTTLVSHAVGSALTGTGGIFNNEGYVPSMSD